MRTGIDLNRLRHFTLLVEELNFTRAAARANLSQTAFSRSILALEAAFNLSLFDRGTRSVRLSPAGQQLVPKARRLLSQSNDLLRELHEIANAEGGELSIGASPMAIDSVIGDTLPTLMKQKPRLKVHVEVSHWRLLQQHLEQERIEFFVGYPGLLRNNPEFIVTRLPSLPSSVFCRPKHPLLSQDRPPRPHDLSRYAWSGVQLRDRADADMRRLFGVPENEPLPMTMTCDSQTLLRQSMLRSESILFTWSSWLMADVKQGKIVDLGARLRPALPPRAWMIECAIVQSAGRTASPAARVLIDLMKS